MSRRVVLLLAFAALALIAVAVVPWTLSRDGLAGSVAQQLRKGYGVDLEVRGRSTIAFLPVPRLKFEDVSLASAEYGVTAQGGTLRGELRLLPLLFGRVEVSEVALSASKIAVNPARAAAVDWPSIVSGLAENRAGTRPLRRLVVTSSSIRWADRWDGAFDDVGLVLNWPNATERLELAGWVDWRGERVAITQVNANPRLLVAGEPSPFILSLATSAGRIAAEGEIQLGGEPRVTGAATVEARAVRDFVRWSGVNLPLGSVVSALSVDGEFSADRRRLTWPDVAVKLGKDSLEGSLTLRFDGSRPVISGTLAAESLDLSDTFAPFLQARTASGLWSGEDVSLARTTGGDLDLRLSATDARIGRLKLGEMAASVLVRPDRIEASLGRADLNEGTLKGRLTLSGANKLTEVKGQATFDGINLAATLADLGQPRWITGIAQGQFSLEGSGRTVADLVRRSFGKASIAVKNGEVLGIGLEGTLRRIEKQPLSASLEWKGGRTAFERAVVNLNVGAGIAEITDGMLLAPTMRTALEGRISLVDRSLAVRAHVIPTTASASASTDPAPLFAFDVQGGWDDVAIIPDARAFIERSRAAKPLFSLDRLVPAARAPAPTAQ